MIRAAPLWLLAGCPYVFGPPDLSHVGPVPPPGETGASTATGTTGDTAATDTDLPTTPTGDTAPPIVGPVVTEVLANPLIQGLALIVSFEPAGALDEGGSLFVSVDGAVTTEVAIPGDAVLQGDHKVVWTLPLTGDPCEGLLFDLSVSLRDSVGVTGPELIAPIAIPGLGVTDEAGGPLDLGLRAPPFIFCGVADNVSETDHVVFQTTVDGPAVFLASWEDNGSNPPEDIDYSLFGDGSRVFWSQDTVNPEIRNEDLFVGVQYDLELTVFGGDTPYDWLMAVVPEPVAAADTGGTGDTGP